MPKSDEISHSRLFNQLKTLSLRHDLYLCLLGKEMDKEDESLSVFNAFCEEIYVFNINKRQRLWGFFRTLLFRTPHLLGTYYFQGTQKMLDRLLAKVNPHHILCEQLFLGNYIRNSKVPKTMDLQTIFSKQLQSYATEKNWLVRQWKKQEYKRTKQYEQQLLENFDNVVISSKPDEPLLKHVKKTVTIPNGIDGNYFYPHRSEKAFDLIFVGNMQYAYNEEAALFLLRQIMPKVWKEVPNAVLAICGDNPSERILSYAAKRVIVTDYVEDIREYYAKSAVFIAPLMSGSGLQNRLLEAMSMQLPCIVSPLAKEPVKNLNENVVLVCATSTGFASGIITLLENPTIAENLANKGFDFVRKNYNWITLTKELEALIVASTPNVNTEEE